MKMDAKALYEMGKKLCEMAESMGYEESEEIEGEESVEEESSDEPLEMEDKESRKRAIIAMARKGRA